MAAKNFYFSFALRPTCANFANENPQRMKQKLLFALFLGWMLGINGVQAQTRLHIHRHNANSQADIVQNYVDSLLHFRALQDSATLSAAAIAAPSATLGMEYNVLFLPPTFYKRVSRNLFSLNTDASQLDSTLLALYLSRPDLVKHTETQLVKAGDILQPTTIQVEHAPDIVEQVAPKPVDASIEPVDMIVLRPNFWNYSGDYYLQFLQNYVSSNWYKGGESNYSMVGSVTINANYNNKQKVKWDNKLEMKLGLQTSRQDSLHSVKASENLFRITSKLGLQASKRWYYTIQMVGYTQFMRQWVSNSQTLTTDFLGPLNINVSIGMDYNVDWAKSRLKGSIHLAPLAYNFRYVNREELATRYGIDEGHRQLHNFGSQFTVDLTWKFAENIRWKTRMYGYTTYERAELEWENTFTFQFNKWISTNVFIYPRFDDSRARDDHHGYFQLKEYTSLGFAYSF